MRLTDISIRNLPAPATGQKIYRDDVLTGFCVRVSRGGTKSFVLVYGTERRFKTLGKYGVISLAEARTKAKQFLAALTLGHREHTSLIFEEALTLFLDLHCAIHNKPSTQNSTRKLLENNCLPKWRKRHIHTIETQDVAKILDAMIARGSAGASNNCYAAMSKFFNWCLSRGMIASNPVAPLSRPSKTNKREHTLNDQELACVWHEAGNYPVFGTIVRLLLLTGARRSEIATLRWDHITDDTLTFYDTKTNNDHTLPLTPAIKDVLATIPQTGSVYLFPAHGKPHNSFSGFGKCKARLDKELGDISHWTLHDLRRSTATHMAELGVQPHVIERILNHSTGAISGVGAIYNRHTYFEEMREALTLWHDKIATLSNHNHSDMS